MKSVASKLNVLESVITRGEDSGGGVTRSWETFRTPPRRVPVRVVRSTSNADANRQALKRMSEAELVTGLTVRQLDAFHAAQRARVLDRWSQAA